MELEIVDWRYSVKKSDPEEVQSALKELLADDDEPLTMMDIEDEFDCTVKGLLKCTDGNRTDVISCDDPVHIDFKERQIHLPKAALEVYGWSDEIVPATRIRYVGLPTCGNDLPKNYGDVTVLSVWNTDGTINNIYLLCDDAKSTMLLINSITRLVYETFDKNVTRTHKFYRLSEGPIDVAFCSTDDREKRDILKQKKEADKVLAEGNETSSGGDEQPDEEMPELVKSPMYFVFDEESLLLFEHAFSFRPLHDFRFFREETELSIDTIYVCNVEEQLEVQKTENVFFLYPQKGHERSVTAYEQLVQILREGLIRPKSRNIFKGTGKEYEDFYNSPPEADSKEEEEDSASEDENENDDETPLTTPSDTSDRGPPVARPTSTPSQPPARSSGVASSLLNNLNSGSHLLSTGIPEDMQFTWFAKENEIEKVVRENKTSSADVGSAGLDPQSAEHLQTAIEDIRNKLMRDEFGPAVAGWRGVAKVYGKTLLSSSSTVNEVEMLKRIYFLSG